jgi:PadR family transcriptional regulator PadR
MFSSPDIDFILSRSTERFLLIPHVFFEKYLPCLVLCRRDYYGYELVHTISENIDIAEGTIYPLLRRLTKEGYFTTYLRESGEGPSRKYYQITEKGLTYKEQLLTEWNQFVSSVHNLIREEETT